MRLLGAQRCLRSFQDVELETLEANRVKCTTGCRLVITKKMNLISRLAIEIVEGELFAGVDLASCRPLLRLYQAFLERDV